MLASMHACRHTNTGQHISQHKHNHDQLKGHHISDIEQKGRHHIPDTGENGIPYTWHWANGGHHMPDTEHRGGHHIPDTEKWGGTIYLALSKWMARYTWHWAQGRAPYTWHWVQGKAPYTCHWAQGSDTEFKGGHHIPDTRLKWYRCITTDQWDTKGSWVMSIAGCVGTEVRQLKQQVEWI